MLKSTLLPEIIQTLENNKDRISGCGDIETANANILKVFDRHRRVGYNEMVIQNVQKILIHFLYELTVPIDSVIDHLKGLFVNAYDNQTNLREAEDDFDKKYGTTTSIIQEQFELNESIPIERLLNAAKHHPSPVNSVYLALRTIEQLDIDLKTTSFIDIGSGMGRGVLIASEFPFNQVIGIEISESLHAVCERNIELYKNNNQKCFDVRTRCEDVLNFEFPKDKCLVLYFWEPFSAEIFNKLYQRLTDLMERTGQKLVLVFLGKVFSTIKESSHFTILDIIKTTDKARTNSISNSSKVENTDYYYLSIYSN